MVNYDKTRISSRNTEININGYNADMEPLNNGFDVTAVTKIRKIYCLKKTF